MGVYYGKWPDRAYGPKYKILLGCIYIHGRKSTEQKDGKEARKKKKRCLLLGVSDKDRNKG